MIELYGEPRYRPPKRFQCPECHRGYRNEGQVRRHRQIAQGNCIMFVSPAKADMIAAYRMKHNIAALNPLPEKE